MLREINSLRVRLAIIHLKIYININRCRADSYVQVPFSSIDARFAAMR